MRNGDGGGGRLCEIVSDDGVWGLLAIFAVAFLLGYVCVFSLTCALMRGLDAQP